MTKSQTCPLSFCYSSCWWLRTPPLRLGDLHTDIKPRHPACQWVSEQDLRIKLTDFGEAVLARVFTAADWLHIVSSVAIMSFCSTLLNIVLLLPTQFPSLALDFPPPDIALVLPFTEAITVWLLGCFLAFLNITDHSFDALCQYEMIRTYQVETSSMNVTLWFVCGWCAELKLLISQTTICSELLFTQTRGSWRPRMEAE